MKTAKYITSILLLLLVFAFIGETYVWHIESFETEYDYVTFYLPKGTAQEDMLNDIERSARKNNLQVFVVQKKIESRLADKIIIYGTKGVEKTVKDRSSIHTGDFNSIFLGNVSVSIQDLRQIPDVSKISMYQVVGEAQDVICFKKELVDQYAGAFPRKGYVSLNSRLNIALVWAVVLSLFVLMTLYQVALLKKETVVRMISGENIKSFVFKNIGMDTFSYVFIFVMTYRLTGLFTEVRFQLKTSVVLYVFFLLCNAAFHLLLLNIDYKSDIATKKSAKKVLNISYCYQITAVFLTVLVMSGAIGLIYEGFQFYKQKEFFQAYSDYSYVMLASFDDDRDESAQAMRTQLYMKKLEEGKALSLVDLGNKYQENDNYIFADIGAEAYLAEKIPELRNFHLENKVYFIKPKDYEKTGNDEDLSEDYFSRYYLGDFDSEIIYYADDAEIISTVGIDRVVSELKKNPVIILNGMKTLHSEDLEFDYIWQSTMFQLTDTEWKAFLRDHDFENEIAYKTNAYGNYLLKWEFFKKGIAIGTALLAILLLLETIIINNILNYEYNVNSVELSIKKILGYSLRERYQKILGSTFLWIGLGTALAVAAAFLTGLSSYFYILAGSLFLAVLELLIVLRYVYRMENINVQRILKGGML